MEKSKPYILIVGKGKGNSYSFPIGTLSLNVCPFNATTTIRKFAKQIKDYYKIKNGEIHILGIEFVTYIKKGK